MFEYLKKVKSRLYRDQYFLPLSLTSIIVLAGHACILLLRVKTSNLPIPLHYNVLFGIDAFGPWYMLFLPLLFGVATLLISIVLELVTVYHPLRTILFASFTLITQLFLFVASLLIVQNILTFN